MRYEIAKKDGVVVFKLLDDKVGYPGLEEFQKVLNSNVEQGSLKILLDLSRVKFLDSFGIGMLAGLHRRLAGLGGYLRLCGVNERIRMSLTITRLDKLLTLYDDQESALRDAAPGGGNG